MNRKSVLRWIIGGSLGAVLASGGITVLTWQFWVFIVLWLADFTNEKAD